MVFIKTIYYNFFSYFNPDVGYIQDVLFLDNHYAIGVITCRRQTVISTLNCYFKPQCYRYFATCYTRMLPY